MHIQTALYGSQNPGPRFSVGRNRSSQISEIQLQNFVLVSFKKFVNRKPRPGASLKGGSVLRGPSEEFELTASTQQAHMKPHG